MEKEYCFKCVSGILIVFFLLYENVFAAGYLTLPFVGDYTPNCGFTCYPNHNANDYPLLYNTPIIAPADGYATASYHPYDGDGNYGYMITIDHGNGRKTRCAHLSKFATGITVGGPAIKVKQGQVVAYSGNTGGP